jgi:hypothetical protein
LASECIQRRLTAILAADVAGYSRLIGLDEAATARTLHEHRSAVVLLNADATKVRFLNWGAHDATNEFGDVPYVVLAGTLFLRPSQYEAIGRAAAGFPSQQGRSLANSSRRCDAANIGT